MQILTSPEFFELLLKEKDIYTIIAYYRSSYPQNLKNCQNNIEVKLENKNTLLSCTSMSTMNDGSYQHHLVLEPTFFGSV